MATYGTDLVLVATGSDGSGGTWGEFVGWDGGGAPASETENFIQGAASYSQSFGNPTTGKSIAFDAGSDIVSSIPTGDVVMGWVFMGAATNMYSYASGGHRFGIGASLTNFDMWYISGDDRPPNPYGGWWNVAIDPRASTDATGGTGSAGAWRYFGSLIGDTTLGIRVKIGKGNPHAVDGLLMGRGEIYCTGTGATFTLMAAQNDLVANRWGLLQDTGGGTFLWKGLMSIGQSGTAATFTDSNKTIVVDDTAKTYLAFNKLVIRHVDTVMTLTNVSFTARGTVSPGTFEMVEDGTVNWTGVSFNNWDTFTFLTGGTLIGCNWVGCSVITHGGSDYESCNFSGYEGTADTAYMVYAGTTDIDGEIDNCSFTMGTALTHAISFTDNTTVEHTLRGCTFTDYHASNGNTSSVLYFPDSGSDIDWVINTISCTGTVSYKKVRAGDTVTIVPDPVDITITVKDVGGTLISNAQTAVYATDDDTELMNEDTVAGVATAQYSGTTPRAVRVWIRKASSGATKYKNYSSEQSIAATVGLPLTVTMVEDPNNNATT